MDRRNRILQKRQCSAVLRPDMIEESVRTAFTQHVPDLSQTSARLCNAAEVRCANDSIEHAFFERERFGLSPNELDRGRELDRLRLSDL